jgi:demethylmenaquinone methyltransferase/2-methoxy-6-polyprenyl-1,4-benzoquinol methylase
LRNVVSLGGLFRELGRVVRPGGRIALLDASEPDNPILRAGHGVYFNRIVPVIGGTLSNKTAYSYLPKSMAYLPSVDEMLSMLADAGFPGTERRQLSGGLTQLFVGTRA